LADLPVFTSDEADEPLPDWWITAHPEHPEVLALRKEQEQTGAPHTHSTSEDASKVVYHIKKKGV